MPRSPFAHRLTRSRWPRHLAAAALLALALVVGWHGVALAAAPPETGTGLERQSPIEAWEALSALAIPLVVGVVVRRHWPKGRQTAAMVAVSAVVALGGEYLKGGFADWASADPLITLLTIVTLTQAAYRTIWQAIPLPQLIEASTGGDPFHAQDPYRGAAAHD